MRKIAVLFLLLLAGCVRETELDTGAVSGDAVLSLTIPGTRAGEGSYDENSIVTARLIVYHSNSPLGVKKMVCNTTGFQQVDDKMNCREIIPAGYINVYLIANEGATGISTALSSIGKSSPESAIENIQLSYGNSLIDPSDAGITMFRAHKGLKIMPSVTPDGDGNITNADGTVITDLGQVERNAVKLNVKLVCDHTKLAWTSGDEVTFVSVTIKSIPKQPWLIDGKRYGLDNDTDYFDVSEYPVTNQTNTDGTKAEFTLIVPEHIVSDKERYTYLEIICDWNGSDLIYKLPLGDGLSKNEEGNNNTANMLDGTAPLSDYNLVRNTEYKIEATIKSKGGTDGENLDVYLNAVPWGDPIPVNGDILNRTLNVSAVKATIKSGSDAYIYFNSNQQTVKLDDTDKNSVPITTFLQEPKSVPNYNYDYNPTTKIGMGKAVLIKKSSATTGTYKIYLNAGGLRREIEVTIQ